MTEKDSKTSFTDTLLFIPFIEFLECKMDKDDI